MEASLWIGIRADCYLSRASCSVGEAARFARLRAKRAASPTEHDAPRRGALVRQRSQLHHAGEPPYDGNDTRLCVTEESAWRPAIRPLSSVYPVFAASSGRA